MALSYVALPHRTASGSWGLLVRIAARSLHVSRVLPLPRLNPLLLLWKVLSGMSFLLRFDWPAQGLSLYEELTTCSRKWLKQTVYGTKRTISSPEQYNGCSTGEVGIRVRATSCIRTWYRACQPFTPLVSRRDSFVLAPAERAPHLQ